jgi:hypothetical protein
LNAHRVAAIRECETFLFHPAPHARFVGIADLHGQQGLSDALHARRVLQRGGNGVRVSAHEAARAQLHAAVVAHHGCEHAVQVVMAQHFENGAPRGAGRLAVVRHAGLAARQQRPAHVRGRGMLLAQAAQHLHCGVAVGNGHGTGEEAAFADVEFRGDGVGERVGHVAVCRKPRDFTVAAYRPICRAIYRPGYRSIYAD